MEKVQVAPVPESYRSLLSLLAKDFRTAFSYVSFYSTDSPFVIQAVNKLHKELQRFHHAMGTVVLHLQDGKLFLNDSGFSELSELPKFLCDKNLIGAAFSPDLIPGELMTWLKQMTLPVSDPSLASKGEGLPSRVRTLSQETLVEIVFETQTTSSIKEEFLAFAPKDLNQTKKSELLSEVDFETVPPFSMKELNNLDHPSSKFSPTPSKEKGSPVDEALLSFVAEAWQYSLAQKKNLAATPHDAVLAQSFEKLFNRLLDRMEETTPGFQDISQWFKTKPGDLLGGDVSRSMLPLMEAAVKNDLTSVLFDPATEGLVGDCLAQWGAEGKHDLVEKTVTRLAEGLSNGPIERQMALTHLMDARPWVRNGELLEKVLHRLNVLLAVENNPGPYQASLLLAWDLTQTSIDSGHEAPALALLSTLHFHADEDKEGFPERCRIARHWLFERSNPVLVRQLAFCAFKAGQLGHYPLLSEMAAPLLLEDYFASSPSEKAAYLPLFAEIREALRSVLAERLADIQNEEEVRSVTALMRVVGLDAGLALQLGAWVSLGSSKLKLDLISLIEEMGDPAGGLALRLALFDDSGEIAALAARVIGKIRFPGGLPLLLKAAKIRGERFETNEAFLVSTCESLGDLADAKAIPFLEELARKRLLLRTRNHQMSVRLSAIEALAKINQPEVWKFFETLTDEKNEPIQETLERITREKSEILAP